MGWRFEHPPYADICCRLDEHGGDTEKRHDELFDRLNSELADAIRAVASKPEYAEIIIDIGV